MSISKTQDKRLGDLLEQATTTFLEQASAFSETDINRIPFEGSWSAAQVADHVTKSNLSIIKALQLNGSLINRKADKKVKELKTIFLDFTAKFKSPSFILPSTTSYEKEALISRLKDSIEKIKELSQKAELTAMINHPAFGDITKLEILHFVVYHTQRHTHQLENISGVLAKIKSS